MLTTIPSSFGIFSFKILVPFFYENLGGLVAQRKHRAKQPRHDCRRRGGRGFQRRGRDQVRRSSEVSTEVAGKTGQCRARCTRMLHLTLSLSSTSTRSMAGASRNNQRQKDQRLIKTRGPKQLGILGRLTLVKPLISPYIHLMFYNESSPKALFYQNDLSNVFSQQTTWVLKTGQIVKEIPIIFYKAKFLKLQDDSKDVSLKIGSKVPQKLGPFSHFSS